MVLVLVLRHSIENRSILRGEVLLRSGNSGIPFSNRHLLGRTVFIVVTFLYLQKVQRRMTTFGVDFNRHLQDSNTEEENIPHIISSCIDEIDKRGKKLKLCKLEGVLIWRKVVPGWRVILYT